MPCLYTFGFELYIFHNSLIYKASFLFFILMNRGKREPQRVWERKKDLMKQLEVWAYEDYHLGISQSEGRAVAILNLRRTCSSKEDYVFLKHYDTCYDFYSTRKKEELPKELEPLLTGFERDYDTDELIREGGKLIPIPKPKEESEESLEEVVSKTQQAS